MLKNSHNNVFSLFVFEPFGYIDENFKNKTILGAAQSRLDRAGIRIRAWLAPVL